MVSQKLISNTRPVWGPLPIEFSCVLPASVAEKGCYCQTCAPGLWRCLAAHPQMHTTLKQGPFYDVGNVGSMLKDILSHQEATLTSRPYLISEPLERVWLAMWMLECELGRGFHRRTMNDIPRIEELANSFNWLFFMGFVSGSACEWMEVDTQEDGLIMTRNSRAFSTTNGKKLKLSTALLTDRKRYGHMSPKQRAVEIAKILLHEQLHQYFHINLCNGRCDGTLSQQELCRFICRRLYWMYSHCSYKKDIFEFHANVGNGPVFQEAARTLGRCASIVFNLPEPLGIENYPCHCVAPPSCMSHCMPSQSDQMTMAAKQVESQIGNNGSFLDRSMRLSTKIFGRSSDSASPSIHQKLRKAESA